MLDFAEDRELLRYLGEGMGVEEAARNVGVPVLTAAARIEEYIGNKVLRSDGVDWEAFDRWKQEKALTFA